MGYKRGPVLAAMSHQELIAGGSLSGGISASGVAVRALPADILCVSYPITESIGEQGARAGDDTRAIAALEAGGLQILDASKRFLSLNDAERPGYFSAGQSSSAKAVTSFETRLTLRVTGFKTFTSVLRLLEQNGARKISRVLLASSQFEVVRDELEQEAIQNAVALANKRAAAAGVKPGGVASLDIAFTQLPSAEPSAALYLAAGPGSERVPDQELLTPQPGQELPSIQYSLTASIVMAILPE